MLNLPESIEERMQLLFIEECLSPQKSRLLKYLASHPDAWTHELAQKCAVGYPPNRLGELNKEVMPRYGLYLHCHMPQKPLMNRYGEKSWFISGE